MIFALSGALAGYGSLTVNAQDSATDRSLVDVALDPGHSTWDVGAVGGELREYELTLDVANRARDRLTAWGYSVRMTREDSTRVAPTVPSDPTAAVATEQMARIAAASPARIFVSIHFNGFPDGRLRGTESYYDAENHGVESYQLAAALQGEVRSALANAGYVAVDRGVHPDLDAGKPYGHFFSLRGPFPSALIENLFLTNEQDATALRQNAVRDAIGLGIAKGIASYLESSSAD
ncbi:MAG: N-acetylmuramoyl-L-alanine amidase [Chloroflexota bacterium]|nr:N-acetylmuramoyl-L-alanine amidase [Chloroflexota bacterium]